MCDTYYVLLIKLGTKVLNPWPDTLEGFSHPNEKDYLEGVVLHCCTENIPSFFRCINTGWSIYASSD